MSLKDRMQKTGSVKGSGLISESVFFKDKPFIHTDLPVLNIAFSGILDGGIVPGITILAGQSKTFKTLMGLYCMKAFLDKHEDGIALLYDSEFGITPDYLEMNGIDTDRVVHIPTTDVEVFKFDIVKKLEEIKDGDKVFIMVDSLGVMASKKEIDDAKDEKSVADMTRAKAIRSFMRIATPHLTIKNIPCVIINHVYQELGMYPKTIVGGGTAVTYMANQIFVITKSQIEGQKGEGFEFTINVEKSRFTKESKNGKHPLTFQVLWDKGIHRWSGLFDLAVAFGFIKQNGAWYRIEGKESQVRKADLLKDDAFWKALIEDEDFKAAVREEFKLKAPVVSSTIEDMSGE